MRRVQRKSILCVGVPAASLRLFKSAVPEAQQQQQHRGALRLLRIGSSVQEMYSRFEQQPCLRTLFRTSRDAARPIKRSGGVWLHIFIQRVLLCDSWSHDQRCDLVRRGWKGPRWASIQSKTRVHFTDFICVQVNTVLALRSSSNLLSPADWMNP